MGKWDRRNGQYKGKAHRQDVREHSVTMHGSIVDQVNSDDDEGVHDDEAVDHPPPRIATRICLWEFGQNDPKRDSGSKLKRLGLASVLKIGQPFPGVVLSSEASIYVSCMDLSIVEQHGISGINCSWNRLNEIPFEMMGKGQNQRILPYLLAANTVNYGKPFKLNTAEAVAACLYIVGLKGESQAILSSFSYGEEFIRMNHPLLELYSTCITPADVSRTSEEHVSSIVARQQRKEDNAVLKRAANERSGRIGGYMDDMDLPPMDDDDDDEEGLDDTDNGTNDHHDG